MNKTLVYDMDGTIADLYGQEGWLDKLINSDPSPYAEAEPFYNMGLMRETLNNLKEKGWRVVVVSWLAKNSSDEYDSAVTKAKLDWLNYYQFPYDEVHIVKYGTKKDTCVMHLKGIKILFDDDEGVRNDWSGMTVNAKAQNVQEVLETILQSEEG